MPAASLLVALALLLGAAGCPGGLKPPPRKPKTPWLEPLEPAERLLSEHIIKVNWETFGAREGGPMPRGFLESGWISVVLTGDTEIGRDNVTVELGVDSSRFVGMPAHGCFEGLMLGTLIPLFPDGPPRRGCLERGYGLLRHCPSNPYNRRPLYLSAYAFRQLRAGKVLKRERLLSVDDVADPTRRQQPLGVTCGRVSFPSVLRVDESLFPHGRLRFNLRFKLIVDARRPGTGAESAFVRIRVLNR